MSNVAGNGYVAANGYLSNCICSSQLMCSSPWICSSQWICCWPSFGFSAWPATAWFALVSMLWRVRPWRDAARGAAATGEEAVAGCAIDWRRWRGGGPAPLVSRPPPPWCGGRSQRGQGRRQGRRQGAESGGQSEVSCQESRGQGRQVEGGP